MDTSGNSPGNSSNTSNTENSNNEGGAWKRNVALFVGGQTISTFGSMLVQYAIVWHVTLKTQSGAMMTLFTLAGFLPMLITSPFAGVWADRWNRKLIINLADSAIAFVSLVAAAFLWVGVDAVGVLLVCAAVRAFGQGVQSPAGGALLPQIVPEAHLTRVSGIQGGIHSAMGLAAPAISAALMAAAPLPLLFLVDVVTAAVGIGLLYFFVHVPDTPAAALAGKRADNAESIESSAALSEKGGARYFHDLREGFQYAVRHKFILQMFGMVIVFQLLASPAALLTPLQVTRDFGDEVWRLSAIEITFSLGMMLGGLVLGATGGFKNRVWSMALACCMFGVCAVGLGITGNFPVYLALMAVMGVSGQLYNTPTTVLLQTSVDPAVLGRVFSFFMMITGATVPMGMLIFGPLSDRVPIDALLIGTGAGIVTLLIPLLCSKALRAVAYAKQS
ncbi:MAG: MFS transporter [Oscillospiraceae bacterium]|jgi:DHA3 family macrolide efflux protein-like MFS transporter|nr:MFS transporter [Oscillospiraceae bacterium]